MTSLFCLFTVGVFSGLDSFLGWAADDSGMPEVVTIVAANIKEPNKNLGQKGAIYLTLDSVKSNYDNQFFKMLKYESDKNEPRMFRLPYSRNLHEQLQKVMEKLQKGQKVTGKLTKNGKSGGKGKGKGKGQPGDKESGQKGGGSESLEQEYMFYNLTPGEIQPKEPEKTK